MRTNDYIGLEERFGADNYHPLDIVIERAEGAFVHDVDGKRYLDCLSAYSAVNQGHCHPRIADVIRDQIGRLTLTSRAFRNDQLPLLEKEFCELTGMDRMLPMNTGAEAVETAIKAVRRWAYQVKGVSDGKAEIVVCEGNFHGRTTTIVGFSTEREYREGFGPFPPGFVIVPFGDPEALDTVITENTAAFLVEPVQGEAGVRIPPKGYLKRCEEICRRNNVLLVLDEIQTGLGRTGRLFAYEHENVRPDGLIVGKALSGGYYPVSAFLARSEVMNVFTPGSHGSTFGGNPLACRIAREALRVLVEEKLPERSARLGAAFLEKLNTIDSPHVKEIRGMGLWVGIELKHEAGGARKFCEALKDRGMLCKETHVNVIRIAPPLVIEEADLDWAFEQVKAVLEE
jgi:ornithine--oxo-acid transaminase